MADAESLSLVFLRGHPAEAARVLESVAPREAADLLANIPARIAAPVLAAMLPRAAARSLEGLDDEHLLALLGELGTQSLVAVLRHIPEPRRFVLIDGLPTAAALASRLLMGYMEDSVGAWTDLDVLALPDTTRATDALERVRNVEATVQRVFVTGPEGRLEGWVLLSTLLRAPAGTTLGAIMTRAQAVISAQAPLSGASGHPGWANASLLPVVESGGRLLGVLTRDALARAIRPAVTEREDSVPGALARGYWYSISGGVGAIVSLLPTAPRVGRKFDER